MAGQVTLRFYEELNDFLPVERRKRSFTHPLDRDTTAAELIREYGIPLEQVDLILINGISAALSQFVQDGDRISIYPVFESIDISSVSRVRPKPLRQTRFLVGRSLKELGVRLSSLGFDTKMEEKLTRLELARTAKRERRILLTCDDVLPTDLGISRWYRVSSADPDRQVREVLLRFDLHHKANREHSSANADPADGSARHPPDKSL